MAEIDAEGLNDALLRIKQTIYMACSQHPEEKPDEAMKALLRDWSRVEEAAKAHLATLKGAKSDAQNLREITDELKAIGSMLSAPRDESDCATVGDWGSIAEPTPPEQVERLAAVARVASRMLACSPGPRVQATEDLRKALAALTAPLAPRDELEEARAELGAWLVNHPGWYLDDVSGEQRDGSFLCYLGEASEYDSFQGTAASWPAAIRAALSRARGEGT